MNLTVGDVPGRVTFDYDTYLSDTVNATTTTPVDGDYAVARFTSGGELLSGWSVALNGDSVPSVEVGKYTVSARRDSTGIWLKVSEIQALVIVLR